MAQDFPDTFERRIRLGRVRDPSSRAGFSAQPRANGRPLGRPLGYFNIVILDIEGIDDKILPWFLENETLMKKKLFLN